MPKTIRLYKQELFGGSYRQTLIFKSNCAPGPMSGGGIDSAVAARIGYKDLETGERCAGSLHGRVLGICCGITAAWMVAFLGGNLAARSHEEFTSLFMGPLRFQGAYVKDYVSNSSSIKILLEYYGLRNTNRLNVSKKISKDNIFSNLPTELRTWAGYLSVFEHAIGIGYCNYRYFIMEPNAGLFEYINRMHFLKDIEQFLCARQNIKSKRPDATMKGYFYTS